MSLLHSTFITPALIAIANCLLLFIFLAMRQLLLLQRELVKFVREYSLDSDLFSERETDSEKRIAGWIEEKSALDNVIKNLNATEPTEHEKRQIIALYKARISKSIVPSDNYGVAIAVLKGQSEFLERQIGEEEIEAMRAQNMLLREKDPWGFVMTENRIANKMRELQPLIDRQEKQLKKLQALIDGDAQ